MLKKFITNYPKTNSNFLTTCIQEKPILTNYLSLLYVFKNILPKGCSKLLPQKLFWIFFLFSFKLLSQPNYSSIPVYHNQTLLSFPWIGGLDNPRFQNIDLNQDGFQDLIVLDAQDNKLLTFLHSGIPNSTQFIFAPQYIPFFPSELQRWILLVDYNHDNEPDIFTTNQYSHLKVYKNLRKQTGNLEFQLVYNPLYAEISPGTFAPLSISDIPSIVDVDYDGDVDLLAWGPSGNRVELYRNFANTLDTLDLRIRSFCWGQFTDIADTIFRVQLHQPCNYDEKTQHIGGVILALSLNGDTLIDALITDYGTDNVVAVLNGGTRNIAHMVSQDTFFPSYDVPVNLSFYPAIFSVDVNADGIKDLLFSPNGYDIPSSGLYFQNHSDAAWLYLNQSNDLSPYFHLHQKNFFYESFIDGGSNSIPVLFDEDLDGDLDFLLLANQHTHVVNGIYNSQKHWRFYENIGSNAFPVFSLKTTNYHHFNDLTLLDTLSNLSLATADIDNDGDTDFFIGHKQGKIIFFENQFSDSANYVLKTNFYASVQVQANSAPHFADIDQDNDLDLIVGSSDGTLSFYENIGTNSQAQWASPVTFWGNIQVTDEFNPILGNAKPFWFDYDKNGTPNLLIGNSSGFVKVYEYLGNHQFQFLGDLFGERLSMQVVPFVVQFPNQDSICFFIGCSKGGVYLFKQDSGFVKRSSFSEDYKYYHVFPNPFHDKLQITTNLPSSDLHVWEIYDLHGNLIDKGNFFRDFTYSGERLQPSVYILKIQNIESQQFIKIVKGL